MRPISVSRNRRRQVLGIPFLTTARRPEKSGPPADRSVGSEDHSLWLCSNAPPPANDQPPRSDSTKCPTKCPTKSICRMSNLQAQAHGLGTRSHEHFFAVKGQHSAQPPHLRIAPPALPLPVQDYCRAPAGHLTRRILLFSSGSYLITGPRKNEFVPERRRRSKSSKQI